MCALKLNHKSCMDPIIIYFFAELTSLKCVRRLLSSRWKRKNTNLVCERAKKLKQKENTVSVEKRNFL